MDRLVFHHHLGLGDHFICDGMVHALHRDLGLRQLILPVKEHNVATVRALYAEHPWVELLVVPRSAYAHENAFITEQSARLAAPLLKVSFSGSPAVAFDRCFYEQVGLQLSSSWTDAKFPKGTPAASALYNTLIRDEAYCLVAATGSVGEFSLDLGTSLPVYRIEPGHTDSLLDWSEIILKATEIHCIDSSVIHLVDRLPTHASRLVYHDVGRGSQFHLNKKWEKRMAVSETQLSATLSQIVERHFSKLPDEHILEINHGRIQWLNPHKATPPALRGITNKIIKKTRKRNISQWRHVCYYSFKRLAEEMAHLPGPHRFLETGSSAHGTNSSLLFFALADLLGASFDTVDLNPEATARVQAALNHGFPQLAGQARCHNMDSVALIKQVEGPFDVVYLDSYDLYPSIFKESEQHGLMEFEAVCDKLADQALILIDDSPRTRTIFDRMNDDAFMRAVDQHVQTAGHLPGKGALVLKKIANDPRFTVIYHEYQLLVRFKR